tara:strand:+ start:269 stop:448 length:180 start_codon:yes stop_codon:yes gene_type:complete
MHIITVDSQKTKIMEAVNWASDEFGSAAFVVTNMFPNNFWNFEFKKSQDAMVFALKWQQ